MAQIRLVFLFFFTHRNRAGDQLPVKPGSLYRGQQLVVFGHYWGEGMPGGRNIFINTPVLIDPGCENIGGRVYTRSDSEDGAMPHHFHMRNGEIDHA